MYKPSKKFSKYSSHQPLECGGCIAVSHLHYSALKGAEYCRECCLTDILWSYVCLLISFCHIQFGSEPSSHYIYHDILHLDLGKVLHLSMYFHSAVADQIRCIKYCFSLVYTAWALLASLLLVPTTLWWYIT